MASLEQARMERATAQINSRRAELELAGKVVGLATALIWLLVAVVGVIAALVALA